MSENKKVFKSSPKRFHPKGITILHEDYDILVVDKMSGLLTVSTDKIKDQTAFFLLNNYVKKGNQKSKHRIFFVHHLDRDASGILVFAKSEKAKRYLQKEWPGFKKIYHAVVQGKLPEKEGEITSYLAENKAYKMYSVSDPQNGKLAKTKYRVLRESKYYSLLEVDLLTGTKHQIRAHFSEKGCPIVGDKLYGEKEKGVKRLALHAATLTIKHPHTKEEMVFETKTPAYFKTLIKM